MAVCAVDGGGGGGGGVAAAGAAVAAVPRRVDVRAELPAELRAVLARMPDCPAGIDAILAGLPAEVASAAAVTNVGSSTELSHLPAVTMDTAASI